MAKTTPGLRIMAIDCCEHVFAALKSVPSSRVLDVGSKDLASRSEFEVDLIAVGMAQYPVRRLFIGRLRTIYPNVPMLILRREQIDFNKSLELIRGEFILSDDSHVEDLEIVQSLRKVMPFEPCAHMNRRDHYETVRKLIIMLGSEYVDPKLTLVRVARKLTVSPKRLSVILNQHVGVSFRELLRQTRIEQAKRMLGTKEHSVKEVAVKVGFTDSHYFSRSFKELTGQNASDYREKSAILR
jgi:AraC-like DNA-binding protein